MNRHEAIEQLKELQNDDDLEHNHRIADMILLELLDSLGYDDVTYEWKEIRKAYA